MPRFIVTAWETMETTYDVEASNPSEAKEKVERLGRVDDIEQIDASVFEVEARSAEVVI